MKRLIGVPGRLRTWISIFAAGAISVASAEGPKLIPINDPTQRVELDGFSILPPNGTGWFMITPPPQGIPDLNVKAYFVKSLTEGVTPGSASHRVSAIVRTLSLGGVKFEHRTELLLSLARKLQKGSFLDKCLERDCARYELTRRENLSRPQFPGVVFGISGQGFIVLHPDFPGFVINLEYRQYYEVGRGPLSPKALEIEIEPFQKSLVLTPIRLYSDDQGVPQHFDEAIRLNPTYPPAHHNRGLAYSDEGDYDRAIEDYDEALRLDPGYAAAYIARGNAYAELGDHARAVEDYDEALRLDPGNARYYNNRGLSYRSLGEYERAAKDWEKAIEVGGADEADYWQARLQEKGLYAGAVYGNRGPELRSALVSCARDPDCPGTWYH